MLNFNNHQLTADSQFTLISTVPSLLLTVPYIYSSFIPYPSSFCLKSSSGNPGPFRVRYFKGVGCLGKEPSASNISFSGGFFMFRDLKLRRFTWLGLSIGTVIGLMFGLMAGGIWPHTPLHATASDRTETLAIATGLVDEDVEAIYFLDLLTGELRAMVMGRQTGQFCGLFTVNVSENLGIDPGKNPHYLMVTGTVNLRRGGARYQASRAVVYVAEATSGKVGAYIIPWNPSMASSGQKIVQNLIPVAVDQFRNTPGVVVPSARSTAP
jgi:hypothetical protein